MIKRFLAVAFAILMVPTMLVFAQNGSNGSGAGNPKTHRSARRRHKRRKSHRRTTGGEYKQSGKDVGQGGKKLGSNVAHGRVIEGGKEFGKGVGRGAKHVAKGTKHAVDPNASKKEKKSN